MPENTQDKKRPGRPPTGKARNVCVTISLPPELHEALKTLGGSPWVQAKIREALSHRETQPKQDSKFMN